MVRAMTYANRIADEREKGKARGPRYELEVVWTDGEHSDSHPGALLPEGLRWLWAKEKKK